MARAVRGSIRVFARLRPLLPGEEGEEDALRPTSATQLEVRRGKAWVAT